MSEYNVKTCYQIEEAATTDPAVGDPQDHVEVVPGGEHSGAVDTERQSYHKAVENLADDAVGVAGLDNEEVDGGVEHGGEEEADQWREQPAEEDPASLGPVDSLTTVSNQCESCPTFLIFQIDLCS